MAAKFSFIIVSFLFFIGTTVFAQGEVVEQKAEDLEVAVGIDKIEKLDFDMDTRIQINDNSVLNAIGIPARKEVLLRGKKTGRTSVIIFNTTGEIKKNWVVNVKAEGDSKIVAELRELLSDIEGVEINIRANKVIVEGEIIVPSDIGKLETILSLKSYEQVITLVNLSPQTQRVIGRKMQKEIQNAGMKDVTVRVVNGVFWLEGVVTQASDKALAMKIAEGYVMNKVLNLSSNREKEPERKPIVDFITVNPPKKNDAPPEKLVRVSSQFVELTKDYSKSFGFRWMPLLGTDAGRIQIGKDQSGGVTTSSQGTLSAAISNLFPKLISMKQAGYARIIQSGMVVTKEGQNAKITKSQNVMYVVGGGTALVPQQPQSAETSFDVSVTPKILEGEKVDLSALTVTVAVPAGSGPAGQPLISKNTITTNIIIKSKESAAIGGIVLNENKTLFDKDAPGAVDPSQKGQVLFNFQRSKNYINNKSQFVVFITPEIIESASADSDEVRKKFRRRGK